MGRCRKTVVACLVLLASLAGEAWTAVGPREGAVALPGAVGLPEVDRTPNEAGRRSQVLVAAERSAILERLRREQEREIVRLRAELDRVAAATRTLAASWDRRFHDLSAWVQMLLAAQILVLGGIVAALMVILQRLRALEPPRRRAAPVPSPRPLEADLLTRDR